MKKEVYWHFNAAGEDRIPRLGFEDGRALRKGETLQVKGPVVMCQHGLHASRRVIDALRYAPGFWVGQYTLEGETLHASDKSVAERRTCLWVADASGELPVFARWCALQVVSLWDAPQIVIEYLTTGDESLRSAAAAADAYAAADAAAYAAAADAYVTARAAADAYVTAAAAADAYVTARAARAAADAAADAAQEEKLISLLLPLKNRSQS